MQTSTVYTISLDEQHLTSLLNHLYQGCTEEVILFIKENQLFTYLIEAFGRIDLFFPNESLRLELHTDPEYGDTTLFIDILTKLPVKEAFQKQIVMNKEWELIKNKAFTKYVSIDTESSSPPKKLA
jgi:hypothetical protein